MSPRQIALVRSSFALLAPKASNTAALFYDNLFAADPSLRSMFKSDLGQQGERLMGMLRTAVGLLDRPQALMPALRALGANHTRYGVRDAHYATVGAVLLKTLRTGLDEVYTDEVHDAWVAVYGIVSRTMMQAAAREAVAA